MVKRSVDIMNKEMDSILPDGIGEKISPTMEGKVQMKKQLGLLEGVAIILGIIFGSGMKLSQNFMHRCSYSCYSYSWHH